MVLLVAVAFMAQPQGTSGLEPVARTRLLNSFLDVSAHHEEPDVAEVAPADDAAKAESSKELPKEEPAKKTEVTKPKQKAPSARAKAQQFLNSPIPKMPEVAHQKVKGDGYLEGSPLYGRQKQMAKLPGGDEEATKDADPEVQARSEMPSVNHQKGSEHAEPPEVSDLMAPADFDVAMTPVSTTMRCIVNLCCQYFLVYTALTVVRAVQTLSNKPETEPSIMTKTLDACSSTVNYAPMLCVLFLATRLRAIQLTQGQTERFGLPPIWTQVGMYVCTWAVFGQLAMVLVYALLTKRGPTTDSDGNLTGTFSGNRCAGWTVQIVKYFLMACLYGGFTMVCVGVCTMEAPTEVYPNGAPPVSVMVQCAITLAVQYFFVYLCLALIRTYNQVNGFARTKVSDIFQLAAYTVNFAPMLCILFAAARMRALQIDPVWGKPQRWAEVCFWSCTATLVMQTLLVIFVPLLLGGQPSKGQSEGDVRFKFGSSFLTNFFFVVRCILLAMLYLGFVGVIVSVCVIEHTDGRQYTPPIPPTTQCVIFLAVQFFLVYLMLWVAVMFKSMQRSKANSAASGSEEPMSARSHTVATLEAARGTVMLCPMLSILFLGTRMRAMQITNNRGAPQGWAQDCMYICVWAVFAQLLMVLLVPLVSGQPLPMTGRTPPSPLPKKKIMNTVVEVLRLICIALMYGGAIGVMIAIFTMTAQNANGRGANIPVMDNVDRRSVDTKLALAHLVGRAF